jgi:hypothetical protein
MMKKANWIQLLMMGIIPVFAISFAAGLHSPLSLRGAVDYYFFAVSDGNHLKADFFFFVCCKKYQAYV